uniref:Uncharacterized protein n=1 Tax=viral metagenome TaxID=1070528 RepID=A0A6C0B9N1_9ZZZZ
MDLKQLKLSKSEWQSIEVPASEDEKQILKLITQGYHNVNIRHNKNCSLFSYLKIEYSEVIEDYLYNKFFLPTVERIRNLASKEFASQVIANPVLKKADLIRIENNESAKLKSGEIYETILLTCIENMFKYKTKWRLHYFTLYKLVQNSVAHVNRHVLQLAQTIVRDYEEEILMVELIEESVELLEKNSLLLKHADITLYEHQKQLFSLMHQEGPKLVLYIAPTGTGKTLSPIGLSESHKIIFVCAARHVGLALAKAAISIQKKVAFAFGCSSADDIRLHYYAAKEYSKNKRSGGIGKVDNSVGDKVEIMICDLKSYLPAMFYMMAFNPIENLVVYWDEPTISLDYETHDLHEIIQKNWSENLIPNMILSSATLPKVHELTETVANFKEKFVKAKIHNIVSHDCKKTIPLINKYGFAVLPHYLSEEQEEVISMVQHCENNQTLLRYFDLYEVVRCILFLENSEYIPENSKIARHFAALEDITMHKIKMHYLHCLKKVIPDAWPTVCTGLRDLQERRLTPNNTVDTKGNKVRRISSVGPGAIAKTAGTRPSLAGQAIVKMESTIAEPREECSVYVTTKDAYSLTDGPTIFLATDVEKIAKFCIQQANIPAKVMENIMEKIEFNNTINEKIRLFEKDLEDVIAKLTMETSKEESVGKGKSSDKKVKTAKKGSTEDSSIEKLTKKMEYLRALIKMAELNETFIPNKQLHVQKWAEDIEVTKPFTCDIENSTIIDIMMLDDVCDSWKVLLLMGIGVFCKHESITYTEIMKTLADQQKLYMIIASSDYIYGTNYQFCHGYLSKDLILTQEKIIQALGRIGRNNIQQDYTIRFRDDAHIKKLFCPEADKPEVRNMNRLFYMI